MKTSNSILLCISLFLFSCEKENISSQQKTSEPKLSYEVITSSGKWFGEYFDKDGKRINTSPIEQPSGWKYEIVPAKLPFEMFVNATSSCICFGTATSPDVTVNFYINDKLVKTEKNNWAKGVTSLVYEVK